MLQVKGTYLYEGGRPFYWLGDTAWLMFYNLDKEEIARYLKNRSLLGYNVVQAVLMYSSDKSRDINEMPHKKTDVYSDEYFEKVSFAIEYAAALGIYFAVLPFWGSIIKNLLLSEEEILAYADKVCDKLGKYDNIIWVVGGNVRGDVNPALFNKIGNRLKQLTPEKLVTYHPFGRTGSYLWFNDAPWLDFTVGRPMNDTILNNKILRHYMCAFGGENYYLLYTYKGDLAKIDFSAYANKRMNGYFVNPENGSMSYIDTYFGKNTLELRPVRRRELSNDWLILFEEEK